MEPGYCCRVCLVEQDHPGNLCSPCSCAGTQKHVHVHCLRKWQESVQKLSGLHDERAFRCSVCRSPFAKEYLPPRPRAAARLCQALRGVGGAICITLLAFGLSGPPWPHLALLVLLLLGTRSSALLALALLLAGSLLAALHARGLRVVMRLDGAGRLGLAVIRHGAPVQGLGPGTLLVASEGLEGTMFRQSVVLLYDHGRAGARGVILTQALNMPPAGAALGPAPPSGTLGRSAQAGAESNHEGIPIRHFLGGPVGMLGEGALSELLLLHTVPGVPGAQRLPLAGPVGEQGPGAAAHEVANSGEQGGQAAESLAQAPNGANEGAAGGPAPWGAAATAAAPAPAPGWAGLAEMDVAEEEGKKEAVGRSAAEGQALGCSAAGSSAAGDGLPGGAATVAANATAGGAAAPRPSGAAAAAKNGAAGEEEEQGCATRRALEGQMPGGMAAAGAAVASGTAMSTAGAPSANATAGAPSANAIAGGGAAALFLGGALSDVLERAAGAQQGPAGGGIVHVYHGICAWAEGQLEGEIRSGAWAFAPSSLQDVLLAEGGRRPAELWAELSRSGRLVWARR